MWSVTDVFLLLSSLFFLLVLSSCLPRWKMYFKYKCLPPGPFCFPLLGYLPFLSKNNGYENLRELAKKYGGVFSLHVGSRYVVIVDDFEVLKDCYQREEFLGRKEESLQLCPDLRKKSLLQMSGVNWKEHKKFWQNALRHMSTGTQDTKLVTSDQIRKVIEKLHATQCHDVHVKHIIELAINNIAFYLTYGKTFPQKHNLIQLLGQYDVSLLRFLDLNGLKMFFPWFGKLASLLPRYRNVERDLDEMDEEIRKQISEQQQTLDANDPRSIVDLFLLQMQKPGSEELFNMFTLLGTIKLVLAGSSESTRNTLVWFLMLMAKHPDIQEKVHEELDNVLGRERDPLLEDKSRLPLLDATVMETMRFSNIINMNMPRRVLWDTELSGYSIPKDTIVFQNMTSHFRNPKYWKNPDSFDPTRFLSADGKKIQVPEQFMPFSYGKRMCTGVKVANYTLFLFAASLLQKFRVKAPEGGINMNILVNFTNGQERPVLQFHPRKAH